MHHNPTGRCWFCYHRLQPLIRRLWPYAYLNLDWVIVFKVWTWTVLFIEYVELIKSLRQRMFRSWAWGPCTRSATKSPAIHFVGRKITHECVFPQKLVVLVVEDLVCTKKETSSIFLLCLSFHCYYLATYLMRTIKLLLLFKRKHCGSHYIMSVNFYDDHVLKELEMLCFAFRNSLTSKHNFVSL